MPRDWQLKHELKKTDREFELKIAAATQKHEWKERERLRYDLEFECRPLRGELLELETEYWRREAKKFDVPFPERGIPGQYENWDKLEYIPDAETYFFLTDQGISVVRSLIREEKKYRRDTFLAYATAIPGILGAAIGVLSFLHRSK